jgi:NAD(P)-dependent dehydrogenase (short-subunit alcohol dehydrogenase family)
MTMLHLMLHTKLGHLLERLVDEIRAAGGRARALAVDLTDPPAVANAFLAIDRVDIVVNNAGSLAAAARSTVAKPNGVGPTTSTSTPRGS